MLRAVIFDMDDTLIDWSERDSDWMAHSRECLRPIHDHLASLGNSLPNLEDMTEVYADQARAAWEAVTAPEWLCPRQIDILRNTIKAINLDVESFDIEKLQRMYGWKTIGGVRPFQDAEMVLKSLREAGVRIGLVTNADLPMWMRDAELDSFGLTQYIEVRLTAGDVGRLKPHPEPFQKAMSLLDVLPHEAIFVGDRVQDDVVGARAAGMRAVWIRRSNGGWIDPLDETASYKPNATIYRLADLLTTLDVWYPGWRNRIKTEQLLETAKIAGKNIASTNAAGSRI